MKIVLIALCLLAFPAFAAEVNIDQCASRVLSDEGGLHCVVDAPPPPPTGGWPDKIAIAGCSQTVGWVGGTRLNGFEQITGVDLFTSTAQMGGGHIVNWLNSSRWIDAFRAATDGTEDAILAQLCVASTTGASYIEAVGYLDMLKAEVPGVPVYVMTLDVSPESSPACSFSEYDRSVELYEQLVAAGEALPGPFVSGDDLLRPEDTTDGCHHNAQGAAKTSAVVIDWLDTEF